MQSDWAEAHSLALRQYLERGLSYAEIANALNARFNTAYTRCAAIGRARRMGLSGTERPDRPPRPKPRPKPQPGAARLFKKRAHLFAQPRPLREVAERAAALKLRCVGVVPRHLSLAELEDGDCRYPYGGDGEGEPITFCAHARRERFELLHLAFPSDERPRHRIRTQRPQGGLAACGGGMNMGSARGSGRMKALPLRLRLAHLRALIRQAPARSARAGKLAKLLLEQLTAAAANENRPV